MGDATVNTAQTTLDPATAPASGWQRAAELTAFASFLASLLLGMLVPIYTDEVGWRMQLRAGIDGGVDRLLSDICGPNTIAAPPAFILALRGVTGWFNLALADPLYLRMTGVACAIAWAFLFRALIRRIAADRAQGSMLATLAFGLAGLGTLPFLMVLSRPEQPMLLTTTLALLIAAAAWRKPDGALRSAWLGAGAIVLLGILAASWHMKGVLFLPLFLMCLFFSSRGKGTLAPRLAGMLLLTALSARAAIYWVGRFTCLGDPMLAKRLSEQNIVSALSAPGNLADKIMLAFTGANPNQYILLAAAKRDPMSGWLPIDQISPAAAQLLGLCLVLAWNLAMLAALLCLARLAAARWREKRLDFAVSVPIVAMGTVLVWGISQYHKNDYEATTALPTLLLFIVFPLAAIGWTPQRRAQLGKAAIGLTAVSLASQVAVALIYVPPLLQIARTPGYIDKQRFSISAYGYSALRPQILATARLCHIDTERRATHPLVDDLTYFAMAGSWQPFHRLGVLEEWNGTISDPVAYLQAKGSQGMIVGCRNLKSPWREMAIRNGEFCCISTR